MGNQLKPPDADIKFCAAMTLFYGGQLFLCGAQREFAFTIYIFKIVKNTTPAAIFGASD